MSVPVITQGNEYVLITTSAAFESSKSSKSNSAQQNEYLTEVSYNVVIHEYFFSKYPLLLLVAISLVCLWCTRWLYAGICLQFNVDSERRHFVREVFLAKIFSVSCRFFPRRDVTKFINIYSRNPILIAFL